MHRNHQSFINVVSMSHRCLCNEQVCFLMATSMNHQCYQCVIDWGWENIITQSRILKDYGCSLFAINKDSQYLLRLFLRMLNDSLSCFFSDRRVKPAWFYHGRLFPVLGALVSLPRNPSLDFWHFLQRSWLLFLTGWTFLPDRPKKSKKLGVLGKKTVTTIFWARVLCSLAAEDACLRMRVTLGVVLIRSLVFHVCVPECSRNGFGMRLYLLVREKFI